MNTYRVIAVAISAMLVLGPPGMADTPPAPPVVVAASGIDSVKTLVAWIPDEGAPLGTTYHVYGVSGTVHTHLVSTEHTFALVNASYEAYAVTAAVGSQESDPQFSSPGKCIRLTFPEFPYVEIVDCNRLSFSIED